MLQEGCFHEKHLTLGMYNISTRGWEVENCLCAREGLEVFHMHEGGGRV